MIIGLKVKLVSGINFSENWSAEIEVEDTCTLEDLHYIIQSVVEFDNDHMYSFFVSSTDRSRDREFYDDENGRVSTVQLGQLFPLPEKKSLFYLFDWGDSWIFKISRTRKQPHEPVPRKKYPLLVSESGVKPEQYS